MHKLVILEGDSTPREVEPGSRELRIGRDAGESVVLHDRSVSREHAIVRRRGDELLIEDAGSAFSTFVNDRRLEPGELVTLLSGDVVRMGGVQAICRGTEPTRDLEQATRDAAFSAQANARILALDGELVRRRAVARPVIVIGSAAHCQIRLSGARIPPEQVLIRAMDGSFRLEGRSSTVPPRVGPAQATVTNPMLLDSNSVMGLEDAQALFLYDYGPEGRPITDPIASISRRRLLRFVADQAGLQRGVIERLCAHRKSVGQCLGEILIEHGHVTPLFWSVICQRLLD